MPDKNTRPAPEGATPAEQLEAAAQRCWTHAVSMDPRVQAIVNAAMGGRLTFEQLAQCMWCLGFISGFGGAVKAGAIDEPSACKEPDCVDGYVHEAGEVSTCWSCSGGAGDS